MGKARKTQKKQDNDRCFLEKIQGFLLFIISTVNMSFKKKNEDRINEVLFVFYLAH